MGIKKHNVYKIKSYAVIICASLIQIHRLIAQEFDTLQFSWPVCCGFLNEVSFKYSTTRL